VNDSVAPIPTASGGFQYVPVPDEHVPAVYRLLANLASTSVSAPSTKNPDPDLGPGPDLDEVEGWSDPDLRSFAFSAMQIAQTARCVFDVLAASPAEWMSTSDLVDATGLGSKIKNMPTQFTRTLNARYNGKPSPLEHRWGTNLDVPRDDQMYYRVTPARAEQWLRIAK